MMRWTLIAAVNDDSVLDGTLLRSPDVPSAEQLLLKRGFKTAGAAYNEALEECSADIAVLAHQDVFLPSGWVDRIEQCIRQVEVMDPHWGVLGVYGVDIDGQRCGYVYSTGLNRPVGQAGPAPVRATSIDEMVIVLRMGSGLRFDPVLPGYHLYGTDICLTARERGFSTYVVTAFCIHNSNGMRRLPVAFWKSYFYLRRKRFADLPIATCCAEVTRGYSFYLRSMLASVRQRIWPRSVGARTADPAELYSSLQGRLSLPGHSRPQAVLAGAGAGGSDSLECRIPDGLARSDYSKA